mmetsp:Transcript_19888/g.18898  ORF Transcript_19888/g.18898 Transcript_19888/m.18898 type:complete len:269 (-) Transcript_19888:264-1070(-)
MDIGVEGLVLLQDGDVVHAVLPLKEVVLLPHINVAPCGVKQHILVGQSIVYCELSALVGAVHVLRAVQSALAGPWDIKVIVRISVVVFGYFVAHLAREGLIETDEGELDWCFILEKVVIGDICAGFFNNVREDAEVRVEGILVGLADVQFLADRFLGLRGLHALVPRLTVQVVGIVQQAIIAPLEQLLAHLVEVRPQLAPGFILLLLTVQTHLALLILLTGLVLSLPCAPIQATVPRDALVVKHTGGPWQQLRPETLLIHTPSLVLAP